MNQIVHPLLLKTLCLAEIGERFSFYAMRGILVLYMVKQLHFANASAYAIFSAFIALVYFTPLIGGYIADKYIGSRNAVIIGGILLTLGYFFLGILSSDYFYFGLALISIGGGLFMPNIANCVGQLYQSESERESGFSIFYTAINIGGFLPPFITAIVVTHFGWQSAFFVSSVAALISTLIIFSIKNLNHDALKKNNLALIFSIACMIILFYGLIRASFLANMAIFGGGLFFITYIIFCSFTYSADEQKRLLVGLLLTGFSILFWMLSEQTAMSLAIFTEFNVERYLFGIQIPTLFFFSLNPLFIVILGPLCSKLWVWLDKKNLNPSIPSKFALGTLFMGISFMILPGAIALKNNAGLVNLYWIICSYFLQSLGELFFSPIGLSMIAELSPKKMAASMMGVWYLATAIAYLLSGFVAKWTVLPSGTNNPLATHGTFAQTFGLLGVLTVGLSIVIFMLVPVLKNIILQQARG